MWQAGQLVRFKVSELDKDWKIGLVVKFDRFLRVAEVLVNGDLYYAPLRLIRDYLGD